MKKSKEKQYFFLFSLLSFMSISGSVFAQSIQLNTVDEAVDIGIQNSKDLFIQNSTLLEKEDEVKLSIRDFLPVCGVSFNESDSVSHNSSDSHSKSLQFNMTVPLFDGGKKKMTYDLNKMSNLFSRQEFELAKEEVSLEIADVYYTYLKQVELVQIEESLLSAAKQQLDIVEQQALLGLALETDYLEYLISYMQIENENVQTKRDLETQSRKLKSALGLERESQIVITDTYANNREFRMIEPYVDTLWEMVRAQSVELSKNEINLYYIEKQIEYSQRWFLPSVSLQSGITFSGENFPLTEPQYTMKLVFSFDNSKLFPVSLSTNLNSDGSNITGASDNSSVTVMEDMTGLTDKNTNKISLLQARYDNEQAEEDLYENVYDTIVSHDDAVRNVQVAEKSIELYEKKLEITKTQLEKGEIKHIDYLNELISLAQKRIELLDLKTEVSSLERSIEIMIGIPFGEMEYVVFEKQE